MNDNPGGAAINWPKKTRELYHNHFDSTIWNDFKFRDNDIFIATYAKSGTTWMQQIISQLIFNGETEINVAEESPWVDLRLPPEEVKLPAIEAQTHRRFLKTHLPLDALVYSPTAKYIYIGRDGRDVVWSFYNHHSTFTDEAYEAFREVCPADIEPLEPPGKDVYAYFLEWLERDGFPLWSFWENISTWWNYRHLPNLRLVHFNDLKSDLRGEIRQIADFLGIQVDDEKWDKIVTHCSFDYMKENAEKNVPLGGALWEGGAKTFIHKGTNGRWREVLTAEDNARYEKLAIEKLGSNCARWLATGEI